MAVWNVVLDGRDPFGPWGWLAIGAVIFCTSMISSLGVAGAIALSTRSRPSVGELVEKGQLLDLVNASFALVIAYVVVVEWRAVWLVAVIGATLVVAYRSQELALQRAAHLERLADFGEAIARESDVPSLTQSVVREIAESFAARSVHLQVDAHGVSAVSRFGAETGDDGLGAVQALDVPASGLLMARGDPRLANVDQSGSGAFRECMAVRLVSDGKVVGRLLVADRDTDVTGYTREHLARLRMFATHAAVAIDNVARSARLVEVAGTDEITGLTNRRVFGGRLAEALATRDAAVLILDLDRFQDVNDTVGHQVGDLLLKQVGARLQELLGEDALAARFGGDAFAVLLPDADVATATAFAWRIHELFLRAFLVDDLQIAIETSIGVAVGKRGEEGGNVVRWADLALYAAKEAKVGVDVYRPEMDRLDANRLNLLSELRDAVTSGDLRVHFQPMLHLSSGAVDGAEALARWMHPTHGRISPEEFIPLAERSQLITPLTLLVLRRSLDLAQRCREHVPDFSVSINVSPRSLREPGFADQLGAVLDASPVPAEAVTLEITETSLLASPELAIAALRQLRELGVRLSVDDFGTGYSSLSYLQRLPVDEIKLDRSFLGSLDHPQSRALLEGVVALCQRLGKSVVGEGVEDNYALMLLSEAGCDRVQGFLVARAMSAEGMDAFLQARTRVGRG